jgi:tetratricopeptide (TPR) repeat protein
MIDRGPFPPFARLQAGGRPGAVAALRLAQDGDTEPVEGVAARAGTGALSPIGVLLVLSCLVALLALSARAQEMELFEEDTIEPKDKPPVEAVAIIEDSWKAVVGQKGGREGPKISVPSHEILDVAYGDSPRVLLKGIRRVKAQYYSKAIDESFQDVLRRLNRFRPVGGKPWPLQYCLYWLGRAHLGRAKGDDAAKAREYFERLLKEVPETRFFFEAQMGIGESWEIKGDFEKAAAVFEKAQKVFEKMARTVTDRGLARHVRRHSRTAEFRAAQMLERKGDATKDRSMYDRAKSAYDLVVSHTQEFPDLRQMARNASVRVLVKSGQYEIAINRCHEMIDESNREGRTEYLGGAYNALADCYFERAGEGEEAKPEDLVQARYYYLRVACLYFMEEDLIPKARFRAGRCYEKLAKHGRAEPGAREKGIRQYRLVVEHFSDSAWADQAQQRLEILAPVEKEEEKAAEPPQVERRSPVSRRSG